MKKLGFGLMRLPLINGEFDRIDKEMLCRMVDLYLSRGFQNTSLSTMRICRNLKQRHGQHRQCCTGIWQDSLEKQVPVSAAGNVKKCVPSIMTLIQPQC